MLRVLQNLYNVLQSTTMRPQSSLQKLFDMVFSPTKGFSLSLLGKHIELHMEIIPFFTESF